MKEIFDGKYADLEKLASSIKPELDHFYKKNKKRLGKMDSIVHQLHEMHSERINCLLCANCCKSLGPAIYDKDIDRMSKFLRIKPFEVVSNYLRVDNDGDYVFKNMPCPFLMQDNYCAIYEARPKACREYPHTDRKKFVQIFNLTVKNISTCPIAYETMSDLLRK